MFDLIEVIEKDKNIIYNLMQLYTYELSFFEDETTSFKMQDSDMLGTIRDWHFILKVKNNLYES